MGNIVVPFEVSNKEKRRRVHVIRVVRVVAVVHQVLFSLKTETPLMVPAASCSEMMTTMTCFDAVGKQEYE